MQPFEDQPVSKTYEFGDVTLDVADFRVLKAGEHRKITPRAFEVLLFLIENNGRVVGKQEIFDNVWGDTFVTDNALTRMVKEIRQVIGDDAESPTFIETVPKRGYRFLMPVQLVEETRIERTGTNELASFRRIAVEEEIIEIEDEPEDLVTASADGRMRGNGQVEGSVDQIALLPGKPGSSRQLFILGAVLVGAGLLAAFGYVLYKYIGDANRAQDLRSPAITRLTADGKVRMAAVSPDGKFIAFTTATESRLILWLKNLRSGAQTEITLPSDHLTPSQITFSRDGDFLYYVANQVLYKVSVLGDTPMKVLPDFHGSFVTFSPDGKRLAFLEVPPGDNERTDMFIASTDGSNERQLLATSRRPNMFLLSPSWSPDGKLIACASSNSTGYTTIVTVRVDDGTVSELPRPSNWSPSVWQVLWKPDGSGLLVGAEETKNLLSQIWSLSYPDGEIRRVTDDSHSYKSMSISADGRSLVAVRTEQEAHLWIMPGTGDVSQAKQITTGFEKYDGVFSIDWVGNDELIYGNAPSGRPAVWKIGVDGRGMKELWPEGKFATASPDGQYIVYQTDEPNDPGLYRVSLRDGEKKRLTTGPDESPTFSPDGKWLIFTRYYDDVSLWKMPSDASAEPIKLTDLSGYPQNAAVSPDGEYIAFYRAPNGLMRFPQLAVIPFEGGPIVREFDVVLFFAFGSNLKSAVQWTADGKAIYFVPYRPPLNIWRQPFDGSAASQVTEFNDGLIFNFAFSPDGKQLAVSRGTLDRDAVLITDPH